MENVDIVVVGGGIVGLATAFQTIRAIEGATVHVLEKESDVGQHQSGRNSGVLHSGIYYAPGSLKAINCRAGKQAMELFCREQGIPFETCGKVIVAVSEHERPALQRIYDRGVANGVSCRLITPEELKDLEPHASGVAAIHVPETGIVDFVHVCRRLAELIQQRAGRVHYRTQALAIRQDGQHLVVETSQDTFRARAMINCAGLHSDRVMASSGQTPPVQIIPFRGEYYELAPAAQELCRNLIYPVPDPGFPFLGVHFTRMIQGGVECGPNAVLALAREGYRWTDVSLRDSWQTVTSAGFRKLAFRYWRMGWGEMVRSWSKSAFVRALSRLVPEIRAEDLIPGRAGVRAQAVTADGTLVDDFLIQQAGPLIHVINAPSPAATSALNIGKLIVERLRAVL